MEKVSALEKKYNAIKEKLREQTTFYMEDVQAIFPEMKQSSIYWNLSKLVERFIVSWRATINGNCYIMGISNLLKKEVASNN